MSEMLPASFFCVYLYVQAHLAMAEKKTRKHPILRTVLFSVLGLWVAVILVLQIALNGTVLTSLANRFVPRFVDADVRFGRISASMFRSFPYLNVTVDSLAVTYPHERFAAHDSLGAPSFLRKLGRIGQLPDARKRADPCPPGRSGRAAHFRTPV